ncbi:MAG: hypothetical protein Q8P12_05680 [bacterium]|nr:hypothetical protein [bacterium]
MMKPRRAAAFLACALLVFGLGMGYGFFSQGVGGQRSAQAGKEAATGSLHRLAGGEASLSELWAERPIVLETGSITCPVFVHATEGVDRLAEQFRGRADFYVMYVDEQHPGKRYPSAATLEDKMAAAQDLREAENVARTILVDDIEGAVHEAYDSLPNSVHLIGTDGIVAYRADWMDSDRLKEEIAELLEAGGKGAAVKPESVEKNYPPFSWSLLGAVWKTKERAGTSSFVDLLFSLPGILFWRLGAMAG